MRGICVFFDVAYHKVLGGGDRMLSFFDYLALDTLEYRYPLHAFYLLPAVAAVLFFVLSMSKKERLMALLAIHAPRQGKAWRCILLSISFLLMVYALTGPQLFAGYTEITKSGLDLYLLIDTSKSMLVTDLAPDRMSLAKQIASTVLDSLHGDRVGIIPFASDAYIQMPLSDDYALAKLFLDVIDTDMISGGGTNLAAALSLACDSFDRSSLSDKVILILSDGEEHDGDSLGMIRQITDRQIKVYTIGIGTEKGGLIPIYDSSGSTVIDYMKDGDGQPVTSRLMAETLRQLAKDGRGRYYLASHQGSETELLLEALNGMKREQRESEQVRRFVPIYQYFLAPGIVLFLLVWFFPERRANSI